MIDPFSSPITHSGYRVQQAKAEALGILAGTHLSHLEQEIIAKFRQLSPTMRQRVARALQNWVIQETGGAQLPGIHQPKNITY